MAQMPSLQNVQSEGKDVQLFRVRMRGIFEKVTAAISTKKFEEIHGPVLKGSKRRSRQLHKKWQDAALDGMVQELDEIIIEENLDGKLKERAKIIEECQEDKSTIAWEFDSGWMNVKDEQKSDRPSMPADPVKDIDTALQVDRRPPGKPTEQVRSFDMKEKIKRKNQLEAFVKSKEAEVEQLRREVSNGRMHIQDLDSFLDTQINKLLSVNMREKQYQAELQSYLDQLTKEVQ